MTIQEFIKQKMKQVFDELHTQLSDQRNLRSRLSAREERITGDSEYTNRVLKELEFREDVIDTQNRNLVESRKLVHDIGNTVNQLQFVNEQNKINGDKGNIIQESCFREINDTLESIHRQTTIGGKKYSYQETRVGKPEEKGYAKVVEGFENGERTYYSLESDGGPSQEVTRYLAYEKIIVGSETGFPMYENKRNPDKDTIIKKSYDLNGRTISQNSALCDSKGKKIGEYTRIETQNDNALDAEERLKVNTVIERIFLGKDGKEVTFQTVIEDTQNGILKRKDFQNGKLVTEAIMNTNESIMRVSNYKDGKMVNSSYFNSFYEGKWELDAKNSFIYDEYGDKKSDDEITDEDKQLVEVSVPDYMDNERDEFQQQEAIFYEQTSFLNGAYISDELREFMENSEFARGLNELSAYFYLNNNAIQKLKENQKKRGQKHTKEPEK